MELKEQALAGPKRTNDLSVSSLSVSLSLPTPFSPQNSFVSWAEN